MRKNWVHFGVQGKPLRKLRSGVTVSDASTAANKLHGIFKKNYAIMLDHPFTSDHGVSYPFALGSHIEWEVTLAPVAQFIKTDAEENDGSAYSLENIQLEYETVKDTELARETQNLYSSGKSFLYEYPQFFRVVNVAEGNTIINENINIPRRSLKGLVILFRTTQAQHELKSEVYHNPDIESVSVTIEGLSNKIYA